mmetsp:Transcript_61986/g.184618  ORF Transcript_61986/g.184618 Transcript_61986/m.184618 type:complete len:495 (+) Transcript_61986:1-1485(+)
MPGSAGLPGMDGTPGGSLPKLPGMDDLLDRARKREGLPIPASGVGGAGDHSRTEAEAEEAAERQALQDEQEEREAEEAEESSKAKKSLNLFYQSRRLAGLEEPRRLQMMGGAGMMMGGMGAGLMGGGGGSGLDAAGASAAVMQLGMSFQHMVRLLHNMMDKCVQGDALDALKQACRHFRSAKYVSGRVMANGADVMEELTSALAHYENKNYKDFGHDIGRTMRKVLLSNSSDGTLPEGLPNKTELANVTTGFLNGFFGSGFFLDITDKDGVPIHIDLHECVSNNLGFFQSIWAATLFAFARKESGGGTKAKAQFATIVALTMMQVPKALRRCNIGAEQEEALMDSIKAMGVGVDAHLTTPRMGSLGKDKVSSQMAAAVNAYTRTKWSDFGEDLGKLFREGALHTLQEKYAVDGRGHFRKRLSALAREARGRGDWRRMLAAAPFALASVSLLLLAAPLVRGRHRAARNLREGTMRLQVEDSDEGRLGDSALEEIE